LRDFCRPPDTWSIATFRAIDDDPLGCASYRKGACAKTLVEIQWKAYRQSTFWKRFCLTFDHHQSQDLLLVTHLTKSSSLALRSLLHCNRTLERLILNAKHTTRKFRRWCAVLAGLAQKTRRERAVRNHCRNQRNISQGLDQYASEEYIHYNLTCVIPDYVMDM
jgi:hypothetical protein